MFKPERPTRGNVNLRPQQELDAAGWVWLAGVGTAQGDYTPFVRFRKEFTATSEPLRFDVSADARFVLLLDGNPIARGPHHGLVTHWYYQSYEVTGLEPGAHLLEAVVFTLGGKGPLCILSSGRGGFVLKAEGAYDAALTTGKAAWRAAELHAIRFTHPSDPETMTGAQSFSTGTGYLDEVPPADAWRPVAVVKPPVRDNEYGFAPAGWALFPTERLDPFYETKTPGRICAAQDAFTETNRWYAASDAAHPAVASFAGLFAGRAVVIPAHTQVRVLWDFGDYYCAFPELETSGGKGSEIRWAWTEGLYDRQGTRGNRAAFVDKRLVRAMWDTFRPDGRARARFTTPWWRSGRWAEIAVKTDAEPLTLTRLAFTETRYPMEPKASFACSDPSINGVQRICVRGLQNCLHEMFMDCPYFEQQMYPGDTRVEMLVLNAIFGDDRMIRFGMGIFDYGRRDNGMVPMNFPTRNIQDSSTYSMCWATMAGDYVRWHGTNAWLRARMPGVRHTLHALAMYEDADGLVAGLPGWSFEDWVPEWDFFGNAPDGRLGLSAINNLLYVYALKSVAHAEEALGDRDLAAYWRAKAARTGAAVVRRFWSEARGLVADTAARDRFSEHAQCLALLTDVLSEGRRARAFQGLLEAKDLARCTVYFSHYLFDTYIRFGRADLFLGRLDLWRGYVKDGLATPLEAPGVRARSDCHAWGAHPLYHLQTGVAGVRPDADGYAAVRVAPQPGGLAWIRSSAPTPKGIVALDLRFEGDAVHGTVTLPPGLPGSFEWKGTTRALSAGVNTL